MIFYVIEHLVKVGHNVTQGRKMMVGIGSQVMQRPGQETDHQIRH